MEKNEKQVDEGLQGNEKVETAIMALQQEPTGEMLAHTLTVIRRRMRESGQLVLALEAPAGEMMQVQAIQTKDGQRWWAAFTGFEEELKGGGSVMSTFLTDMEQLFRKALLADEIQGVILNPWQKTLGTGRPQASKAEPEKQEPKAAPLPEADKKLVIRNATMEDLFAVAEVEAECFPVSEAATEAEFRERIACYGGHFWLLFEDERLVSFVDGVVTDQEDLTDEMYERAELHQEAGEWQMIFGVATHPEH